jgi:hypothetical protein
MSVHTRHVPIANRLIKRRCLPKQISHVRHTGHVPIANRLTKSQCVRKHSSHVCHARHVPVCNRLIEAMSEVGIAGKHSSHGCGIRDVPSRDVFIKVRSGKIEACSIGDEEIICVEEVAKVFDIGYTPVTDWVAVVTRDIRSRAVVHEIHINRVL